MGFEPTTSRATTEIVGGQSWKSAALVLAAALSSGQCPATRAIGQQAGAVLGRLRSRVHGVAQPLESLLAGDDRLVSELLPGTGV